MHWLREIYVGRDMGCHAAQNMFSSRNLALCLHAKQMDPIKCKTLNLPGKNMESPALQALAEIVADGACRLHL